MNSPESKNHPSEQNSGSREPKFSHEVARVPEEIANLQVGETIHIEKGKVRAHKFFLRILDVRQITTVPPGTYIYQGPQEVLIYYQSGAEKRATSILVHVIGKAPIGIPRYGFLPEEAKE